MDVYLAAFSNDSEKQQFAEDRLLIWKIRYFGHILKLQCFINN